MSLIYFFFFFQAEDGIRDKLVTGVQTCALPISAHKLRPVPDSLPDRWMTGTQNHEGLAGVAAAVHYLAALPKAVDSQSSSSLSARGRDIHRGMIALQQYESLLSRYLLNALAERPAVKVWGIKDLT